MTLSTAQPAQVALFISDLHLQPSHPRTCAAFFAFLRDHAIKAQRLYLLGDLFEYWAGDDDIVDPFHHSIVTALRSVSDAGVALVWLAGNRDFLVGDAFAGAIGAQRLTEPVVAEINGQRIALVHGDAQCTDDQAYMQFRAMVRQEAWQQQFLSQSLEQRKAIIAGMRSNSREHQRGKVMEIMDVNQAAIGTLFADTGTRLIIHGHTHRPARHDFDENGVHFTRYVLPDWECDGDGDGDANATAGADAAATMRGGWISLQADGSIQRCRLDGSAIV
jgi:UDP-2,3-diacylglucosamine hydrolase